MKLGEGKEDTYKSAVERIIDWNRQPLQAKPLSPICKHYNPVLWSLLHNSSLPTASFKAREILTSLFQLGNAKNRALSVHKLDLLPFHN